MPATVSRESPIDSNGPLQFPSVPAGETTGGYKPTTPSSFVPTNFGANAKVPLALGVHLMSVLNASERSLVSPMFSSLRASWSLTILLIAGVGENCALFWPQDQKGDFPQGLYLRDRVYSTDKRLT